MLSERSLIHNSLFLILIIFGRTFLGLGGALDRLCRYVDNYASTIPAARSTRPMPHMLHSTLAGDECRTDQSVMAPAVGGMRPSMSHTNDHMPILLCLEQKRKRRSTTSALLLYRIKAVFTVEQCNDI